MRCYCADDHETTFLTLPQLKYLHFSFGSNGYDVNKMLDLVCCSYRDRFSLFFITRLLRQNALLSGIRLHPSEGYWREPGVDPYANKRARRQRRSPEEEESTFEELGHQASELRDALDKMKKPSGHKDNPSRFCRDLMECQPGVKDGKFSFFFSF